jgi:hypothetical protein
MDIRSKRSILWRNFLRRKTKTSPNENENTAQRMKICKRTHFVFSRVVAVVDNIDIVLDYDTGLPKENK